MELSKKDKKVAREMIEKGVMTEFANSLNEICYNSEMEKS